MNLYKDAEKLIEDFFQNFELRVAPRAGCDEVAVQRVKETLANYLEFTGDDAETLDHSELESIFRAALTDFLYEVYFTLEDPSPSATDDDGDLDEDFDDFDDLDEAAWLEVQLGDEDGGFYEILSLGELCDLLREDAEGHSECECLVTKALEEVEEEGAREVIERLEALIDDLRSRPSAEGTRKVLADAYLAVGEVHVHAGDRPRGLAAFRQAARVHGRLPCAFARIAAIHSRQGELELAIAAWQEQIRLSPEDPEPYFSCAHAFERLGRPERAIEMLDTMLTIDGQNASALDMLIRLSQEAGKVQDAQVFRERILGLHPPKRVEDISVWVKHHTDEGNFDGILEHLHKEELDSPGQSVLNLLKALVFIAKDDPDNVEVELLLLRDKLGRHADCLDDTLSNLEKLFGSPRIEPLRRAIAEHVQSQS